MSAPDLHRYPATGNTSPHAAVDANLSRSSTVLPCFPLVVTSFLQAEELALYARFLAKHEMDFGALTEADSGYWKGRTLALPQIQDAEVRDTMISLRYRIIERLTETLQEQMGPIPPLYSDVLNFARWPQGYQLSPHADAQNPGNHPHPFPWRNFAAVIYLNEDYDGGEIYFPELNIEMRPTAGTLVLFPGTLKYLHGVRMVTGGMRHTIASFLTFNASKEDRFGVAPKL
ncbi:MAG: 2OG-Fe(II) oxygenase [Casimicrobium sp.]